MLRDVTTDQQIARHDGDAHHRPRPGGALRHPAAGDRRHAVRRVRPAAGRAVLHAGQLLPRDPGGDAGARQRCRRRCDKLYVQVAAPARRCRCRRSCKSTTAPVTPLSINHQSQFPAVTISFNLAPGAALGEAVDGDQRRRARRWACRSPCTARFQGTAQAFQSSLTSQPYLIAAALVAVYIILGMLYESYIQPLTILSTLPSAGVGALLMLMLAALRSVGDRADRHHPADRHREEERHHDGGLRHHRRTPRRRRRRETRSARPACCASGRS